MIYPRFGWVGGLGTVDEDGSIASPDAGIRRNEFRIGRSESKYGIYESRARIEGK